MTSGWGLESRLCPLPQPLVTGILLLDPLGPLPASTLPRFYGPLQFGKVQVPLESPYWAVTEDPMHTDGTQTIADVSCVGTPLLLFLLLPNITPDIEV